MAKIKYNTETNIIEAADSGMEILHADSVDPSIIETLVEMYNDEYSIKKIEDKLLHIASTGTKITSDEVEYLIDQLTIFDDSIAGQPISAVPAVTKNEPIIENKMEEQRTDIPIEETVTPDPSTTPPADNSGTVTTEATPRRQRRTSVDTPKKPSGVISPQDLIAKYKEKIDITQALSGIVIPEIPGELSKDGERLIKDLHVAYQKLINEYLIKVQEL